MDDKKRDANREACRRYYEANKEKFAAKYEQDKDAIKVKRRAQQKAARIENKARAIEHLGGACQCCGFDNPVALQFHHRDPAEKAFEIGVRLARPWASLVAELDKCDLLCANCHMVFHNGCND